MTRVRLGILCMAVVLTLLLVTSAFGQVRATGRLDGTVVDPTGAVVPGAKVTMVDLATQSSKTTVAGPEGNFVFLALQIGEYRVTVEAPGFQKGVFNQIKIDAGRVSNLTATLQVGGSEQTVEVQAAAQALETTTTTLTTTVPVQALNDLPLSGHDVFNFSVLTAGAQMGGTSRNATIQGLPGGSLNVTLDGITNSSPRFRSGGTSMFAFVSPRLGAVEEMSVSTVGGGADSAGAGAMQMKMVTKRGTNNWHGSGFWQLRNDALNANTWYNDAHGNVVDGKYTPLKKGRVRISEFGGGIGGPVIKNKLFFFVNYEEYRNPSSYTQTNSMLTGDAMGGLFKYYDSKTNTERSFNVFTALGQASSVNPEIKNILDKIAATRANAGSSYIDPADPNIYRLAWLVPQNPKSRYPTARVDYEVNDKFKIHAVNNLQWQWGASHAEDFPGYKNATTNGSTRSIGSIAAEYAITPNLFNEFNIGLQYTLEIFDSGGSLAAYPALNDSRFPGAAMQLNFPYVSSGLATPLPWHRNAPVINLYDNLTWVKGRHTFTFGGSYDRRWMWERYDGEGLFSIGVGMDSRDPMVAQFEQLYQQGNPEGQDCAVAGSGPLQCMLSDTLSDVESLYALLRGTTTSYYLGRNVDPKTKEFTNDAPQMQEEMQHEFGFYFQDSFRATPSLTINYGFRNQFQPANHNTNGTYTNPTMADLFGPSTGLAQPGKLNGILDPQVYLRPNPYKGDMINPAPNVGFAWNPEIKDGFLGKIFGDKKTVFRGSYGINAFTEGMLNFQDSAGNNAGWYQTIWANAGENYTAGTIHVGDPIPDMWTFPESFTFPAPMSYFGWAQYFGTTAPKLRTPYVQNWSFGIQRELGPSRVLEVRYVGNKGTHLWRAYNINQSDTVVNGFAQEFINAQKNLAINTQNGRTGFANNNLPGQVALPIFAAIASPNGSFGGQDIWNDGTFLYYLNRGEAGALADTISNNPYYLCPMVGNAMTSCRDWYGFTDPGAYPINFFRANPYAGTARLLNDPSWSKYNALQVEYRQKYWKGLTFQANYTYSKNDTDRFGDWGDSTYDYISVFDPAMDAGPSPFDIHHTFTAFGTYELPFGKGRSFAIDNPVVDRVIGGWSVSTIVRYQTGRPFRLTGGRYTVTGSDSGVVLNGITAQELQDMVGVYPNPAGKDVYFINPKVLGPNGTLDPQYFSTPAPGQWGDMIYLYGPKLWNVDLTAAKRIPITEGVKMEFFAEFLNAFNHPNWGVGGSGSTMNTAAIRSTSFGRTTSMQGMMTNRQIQFRLAMTF